MAARKPYVISLDKAWSFSVAEIGGKARNLAIAGQSGFPVPRGFCLRAEAYFDFIRLNGLEKVLDYELFRKPMEEMRWEELWDIGLRIQNRFLRSNIPDEILASVEEALSGFPPGTTFSVRSSATQEDGGIFSHAGIHESFLKVPREQVAETIILVWASLWNDRSLLYRKEKGLDPQRSSMPVLIQEMVCRPVSGIGFTADPMKKRENLVLLEMVPDTLDQLVDNQKSPEAMTIRKDNGEILTDGRKTLRSLVSLEALETLRKNLVRLETLFGWPVDVEWTGTLEKFVLLQVRPVTFYNEQDNNQERKWYLSLTPERDALLQLTEKIEKELFPALYRDVERLTSLSLSETESEEDFLSVFKETGEAYQYWTAVYWDAFIPFAHGIRYFGSYYNQLMKPKDSFAFIDLLTFEELLAQKRNHLLRQLAEKIRVSGFLKEALISDSFSTISGIGARAEARLSSHPDGKEFLCDFDALLKNHLNVYYENYSLTQEKDVLLKLVISMAQDPRPARVKKISPEKMEKDYFLKAGESRQEEASQWLRIGRLSWKLRDDDNLLVGKIENQLFQLIKKGMELARDKGLLKKIPDYPLLPEWLKIYDGLKNSTSISLSEGTHREIRDSIDSFSPVQLTGNPASPGLASGIARLILTPKDFANVLPGEILVFDAVQPQMTFLISLASGIIERRGGMLVHSSIIAREMGIPAVNGVSKATERIRTGDHLILNGDLGIVRIEKKA